MNGDSAPRRARERPRYALAGGVVLEHIRLEVDLALRALACLLERRKILAAALEQREAVAIHELGHSRSSVVARAAWSEIRPQTGPWCTCARETRKPRT